MDIFSIGGQKCGTSTLTEYLSKHPKIFVSRHKEPGYFCYGFGESSNFNGPGDEKALVTIRENYADYEKLFSGSTKDQLKLDPSVCYLYSTRAAEEIKSFNPKAKIIVILRNPVDRAYSAFMHLRKQKREVSINIIDAIANENSRITRGWEPLWHLVNNGKYFKHLSEYFSIYDKRNLLILYFEDLTKNKQLVLNKVCNFLEIDPFESEMKDFHLNSSGVPRVQKLYDMIERDSFFKNLVVSMLGNKKNQTRLLIDKILLKKIGLKDEDRSQIAQHFIEDVSNLEILLNDDFVSRWNVR